MSASTPETEPAREGRAFTMADHLDVWPQPIDGCACDSCAGTSPATTGTAS